MANIQHILHKTRLHLLACSSVTDFVSLTDVKKAHTMPFLVAVCSVGCIAKQTA